MVGGHELSGIEMPCSCFAPGWPRVAGAKWSGAERAPIVQASGSGARVALATLWPSHPTGLGVSGRGLQADPLQGARDPGHARDSVVVDVQLKVRGNRSLMTLIVRAERNPIQTSVWFNYLPLVESPGPRTALLHPALGAGSPWKRFVTSTQEAPTDRPEMRNRTRNAGDSGREHAGGMMSRSSRRDKIG